MQIVESTGRLWGKAIATVGIIAGAVHLFLFIPNVFWHWGSGVESQRMVCVANLKAIHEAKEQWALENKLTRARLPTSMRSTLTSRTAKRPLAQPAAPTSITRSAHLPPAPWAPWWATRSRLGSISLPNRMTALTHIALVAVCDLRFQICDLRSSEAWCRPGSTDMTQSPVGAKRQ